MKLFCHPVVQGLTLAVVCEEEIPGTTELLRWSQLLDCGQSTKDAFRESYSKGHAFGVLFHIYSDGTLMEAVNSQYINAFQPNGNQSKRPGECGFRVIHL